jgi:hypothetical protein
VVGVFALANACPQPPIFRFFGVASLVGIGVGVARALPIPISPLSIPLDAPVPLLAASTRTAGGRR